ncbi:MAG: cupredoxin domain-containing protein [Sideroxyarcus sp.]
MKISCLILALLLPLAAYADDAVVYTLVLKDHRFQPAELTVPVGKKIKLLIENRDETSDEFESFELNREKVLPGQRTTTLFIGPLEEGRYPYFGEFAEETAKGVIIAK